MKYPLAILALCTGMLAHAGTAIAPVSHDHLELELGAIEWEDAPSIDVYHLALSGSLSLDQHWLLLARVTGVAANIDGLEFQGSQQSLEMGFRQPMSRDTDLVVTLGPASQAIRMKKSRYEYDAGYTASVGLRFALAPQLEGGGKLSSTRVDGITTTTVRLQGLYRLNRTLGLGLFFESARAEGVEDKLTGLNLRLQF